MKILFFLNGAHEHRPFYAGVGRVLEHRGHEVHYALDSHYTDVLHPDAPLNANVHYFSDYFRQHVERKELPKEFADTNVSVMMFPEADRLMHTHARRRRSPAYFDALAANLAHFFVDLFDAHRFDAVVYEGVSNGMSYFACEVARKRGARFIGFFPSRLPNRTDVLDHPWGRDSRLEPTFRQIQSGALSVPDGVRAWVRDYIDNFDRKFPDYIARPQPFDASLLGRYAHKRPILRMLRSMRYRLTHAEDARYAHQLANPLLAFPEQLATESYRHAKLKLLRKIGYESEVDLSRPYFLYPMQFHPESATSVSGPAFNDEWSNIEGIVQNLPHGHSLYVKDHKHAAGRQSLDFYSRVRRLPNVVLVSPFYETKRLIRHSKGVVVGTSTLGFEALVMGKPVFVLGHPFYDFFPSCVRVPTFDGAYDTFKRYDDIRATPADIEALVAAYVLTSEEGRLDLLEMYADPNVMSWIGTVIERRIREHHSFAQGRAPGPSLPAESQ